MQLDRGVERHALADRSKLEHAASRFVDGGDPLLDQHPERRRYTLEGCARHAIDGVDQIAALRGHEEFPGEQRIARRSLRQLGEARGVEGPLKHGAGQRPQRIRGEPAELDGRAGTGERRHVGWEGLAPSAGQQRRGAPARGEPDRCGRSSVQPVGVVDHQQDPFAAPEGGQLVHHRGKRCRGMVAADDVEDGCQRPESEVGGTLGGDDRNDTGCAAALHHGIEQTGLADAGLALDHDRAVGEGGEDGVEGRLAPGWWRRLLPIGTHGSQACPTGSGVAQLA
ncbi:MAG: hypothetical protein KDB04_08925 [Acidimicrobiales bacterium]|nr:hypothetical protein [Acidimicrobiales bacterium]